MGVNTAALAAVSGWRAAMAAATAACKGAPPSSSLSVQSFVVELEHSVEAEFSEKSSPKKGQPPSAPSSMLAAMTAEYGAAALLSPMSLETFASLLPTSSSLSLSASSSSSSALSQATPGSKVTAAPPDGIVPDSAALLTGGGGGRKASLGSGTNTPSTSPAGLLRCIGAGGSPMAFFAKPRGPMTLAPLQALPPAVGSAAALATDEAPMANARLLCCSPRPP